MSVLLDFNHPNSQYCDAFLKCNNLEITLSKQNNSFERFMNFKTVSTRVLLLVIILIVSLI